MKIVCDQYIPYLKEAIEAGWEDVEVVALAPNDITAAAVRHADVLVVRTRTHVGEALLSGSRVRLVCTATIGYDHIDRTWCEQHGVKWVSCPGCNAQAVCDWVEEAISMYVEPQQQHTMTVGIVGVGHVGSLVAKMCERKGYTVLLNDPPKGIGVSLDEIASKADIITYHTPLTREGEWATYHLCNKAFLNRCKPHALVLNAARGGVVDEAALLRSGRPYMLDTWEGEPQLNHEVLAHAQLASMHIAGYSVEGKKNATEMCLAAISKEFGHKILTIDKKVVSLHQQSGDHAPGWLLRITQELKKRPDAFEQLRKQYKLR